MAKGCFGLAGTGEERVTEGWWRIAEQLPELLRVINQKMLVSELFFFSFFVPSENPQSRPTNHGYCCCNTMMAL